MDVKRLRIITIASVSFLLVACGGEEESNINPLLQSPTDNETTTSVLNGSVGDGPITGATITVHDNDGNLLDATNSTASANYQITIRTGRNHTP